MVLKNNNMNDLIKLFVILLLIILLGFFITKNYKNLKESFVSVCQIRSQGRNNGECYYNRLMENPYRDIIDRGNYFTEVQLLRRPGQYDDSNLTHRIGLILFYLKYRNIFPRIGCGNGWENKIGGPESDVMSDWAYYLYKIVNDTDLRDEILDTTNPNNVKLNVNALLYHSTELEQFKNAIDTPGPNSQAFRDLESEYPDGFQRNMFRLLLISCLGQYILSRERTGYNASFRWGIPTYMNREIIEGRVQDTVLRNNSLPFNYYYNIPVLVSDSTGTSTTTKYLKYNRTNGYTLEDISSTNLNSTLQSNNDYKFRIIYHNDCGDYFVIQNASDNSYLKVGEYDGNNIANLESTTMIGNASGLFFDYQRIENNMTINITNILIPPIQPNQNLTTRTGDLCSILIKVNRRNEFLSHFIIEGDTIEGYTVKAYKIPNLTEDILDIRNSIKIPINNSGTNKFRFIRQDLTNNIKYVYKYNLINDTSTGASLGSKKDIGGIYQLNSDSSANIETTGGEITNFANVDTNQTVFPVFGTGSNVRQCVYTGKKQSIKDINNVCSSVSGCYGEYESPSDNYKRIYVGTGCDAQMKVVERTGTNFNQKERRGAINCVSGTVTDLNSYESNDNTSNVNICFQPKFSDNVQPGTMLVHPEAGNNPQCRENRDYGMLDGDKIQMFVNNSDCMASYTYMNDILKGDDSGNRQCTSSRICEFSNTLNPESRNYRFLNNHGFSTIRNQNLQLKKTLNDLNEKLSTYKQDMHVRSQNNSRNDEILVDELNKHKFNVLDTNLRKLNQYAFDEINNQKL